MQFVLILKPACFSCNAPSLSKHCTNLLLRVLQNTFPTAHFVNKVIPLYLSGSFLYPFINILHSLHCQETNSSCCITENNCPRKSIIPDLLNLSNLPTIPSLPPVLLFLSFVRHFAISPFCIFYLK